MLCFRGGRGKQIESFHVFEVCEQARERGGEREREAVRVRELSHCLFSHSREKRERKERATHFFFCAATRVFVFGSLFYPPFFSYFTSVTEHEFYAVSRALCA